MPGQTHRPREVILAGTGCSLSAPNGPRCRGMCLVRKDVLGKTSQAPLRTFWPYQRGQIVCARELWTATVELEGRAGRKWSLGLGLGRKGRISSHFTRWLLCGGSEAFSTSATDRHRVESCHPVVAGGLPEVPEVMNLVHDEHTLEHALVSGRCSRSRCFLSG